VRSARSRERMDQTATTTPKPKEDKNEKVTIYHHFDREVHSRSSFDDLTKLEEALTAASAPQNGWYFHHCNA